MDLVMTWIKSNKAICWAIFWVGWFFLSPTTIIPGAVAVGVGNVIYKERALNLVTICAVYLGVMAILAARTRHHGLARERPPLYGLRRHLLARCPRQALPDVRILPDHHDRQRVLSRQRRPLRRRW